MFFLILIIKIIVLTLGFMALLRGMYIENAIMMGQGLYLLIAINFFDILHERNQRRDLEGTIEVYHDAYMKLVKKKK